MIFNELNRNDVLLIIIQFKIMTLSLMIDIFNISYSIVLGCQDETVDHSTTDRLARSSVVLLRSVLDRPGIMRKSR